MHVLYVHPAFPGQFRHAAPRLAAAFGSAATFVTRNNPSHDLPGVQRIVYELGSAQSPETHPCNRRFEDTVAHALGVYNALKARPDVRPDLIVAHGSFGLSVFLPYLYDCPIMNFFEYFYRPVGQDLGYRPEMPVTEMALLRCGTDNAMTLLDLENCDRAWTPTEHQRGLMPEAYRQKVEAIHDGIDTELFKRRDCGLGIADRGLALHPRPLPGVPGRGGDGQRVLPDGTVVPAGTRIVTYVTRGFEMARGFDVFMAAAKRIYDQFPDVVFAVAGGDQIWYGAAAQRGGHRTFRERVLAARDYDLSKFRFLGVVPEEALVGLYSVSDLHVYLTIPYFTSWSPLEAMSCACVMIASDTPCVREYLRHGENGLLCDFFDAEGLARLAVDVLKDPAAYRHLGEAARRTIERTYSVDVTLPRIKAMFESVAAKGARRPSVRAELLVRPGRRAAQSEARAGPSVFADSAVGDEPEKQLVVAS